MSARAYREPPPAPGWEEIENAGGKPMARISKATREVVQVFDTCASTSCMALTWLKVNAKGTIWVCDGDCLKSWKAQRQAAKYAAAKAERDANLAAGRAGRR